MTYFLTFWVAHLFIHKSEADTKRHRTFQAPPNSSVLPRACSCLPSWLDASILYSQGSWPSKKTTWHLSQGCSVFLTFMAGRMFSDSGTQQSSIPDSTGIFLSKPHCQRYKNKWSSVALRDPGGKQDDFVAIQHTGKTCMTLATFINSPSVVWMLKKFWLKVMFSSTGSPLGRLPDLHRSG